MSARTWKQDIRGSHLNVGLEFPFHGVQSANLTSLSSLKTSATANLWGHFKESFLLPSFCSTFFSIPFPPPFPPFSSQEVFRRIYAVVLLQNPKNIFLFTSSLAYHTHIIGWLRSADLSQTSSQSVIKEKEVRRDEIPLCIRSGIVSSLQLDL